MVLDMHEYYTMIKSLDIDIIYSGPLWSDDIEDIAVTLKKRMAFDGLPLSASHSVFSVFVEQMSNVLMYSKDNPHSEEERSKSPKGVFILGSKGKTYFIQSGNIIKNESVALIKGRIDHLNTLDKKELRQFYKEQIKAANTNPESKGAGIGLIEIARRASDKIEYSFEPYGEGFTFFTMFVTIKQGD